MGGGLSRKKTPWDPVWLHVRPSCGSEGALHPPASLSRPRFLAPFLPLLAPLHPELTLPGRGLTLPGFSWSPLFSLPETTCHDCSHLALFSASGFQLKTTADIKPRKDTEEM